MLLNQRLSRATLAIALTLLSGCFDIQSSSKNSAVQSSASVQEASADFSSTLLATPTNAAKLPQAGTYDGGTIASGGQSSGGLDGGHIGQPANLKVQPPAYDFQVQSLNSYPYETFTVTNDGDFYAYNLTTDGLAAPYEFRGGSFPGSGGTCTASLAPKQSCTIVVAFHPTSLGAFALSGFSLLYNNGAVPIGLKGVGTDVATLHLSNEIDDTAAYGFGTVAYGTTLTKRFRLQYWGAVPATGVVFSVLNGQFALISNDCSDTVTADCELTVQFRGNQAGTASQTLKVTYDNSAYTAETSQKLSGTTTAQTTPAVLGSSGANFGRRLAGSVTTQTITVNKSGSFPATQVSALGFNNSVFSFAGGSYPGTGGTCGSTIAANCTVVVSFQPAAAQNYSGALAINYFDNSRSQQLSIPLQGQGANHSALTITPVAGYDFGNVAVHYPAEKTFTVQNDSGSIAAVGIAATSQIGPFTIVQNCPDTLAPGASCNLVVGYTPPQTGPTSGSITVVYFDGTQVQTITQPLIGNGDGGALIQFNQSTVDFGNIVIGTTQIIEVDLSYYGVTSGGNCTVSGIPDGGGSTGGDGGGYSFPGGSFPGNGGTCSHTIDSPCAIHIAFIPTETTTYTTQFTIYYDNGSGTTQSTTITLTGTGYMAQPASLSFNPTALDFGRVAVGSTKTQLVTLKHAGQLTATSIAADGIGGVVQYAGGTFPGTGGNCGMTLGNGNSCQIALAFTPSGIPAIAPQTLTVNYSDGIQPQSVALNITGSGYSAAVMTASSLNLGTIASGGTADGTITWRNSGTLPASSLSFAALPAPFTVTADNCTRSGTLNPGNTCAISVHYAPTAPGVSNPPLTLNYFDGNGASQASVALNATATVPVLIANNGNHSCARKADGSLKCWGENNYGQLGQGDTINRGDSTQVGHGMGASLAPIALGTGHYAQQIAVGYWHTCVILEDGSVKCWGENNYGQLGLGISSVAVGSLPNQMGNSLPTVNLGAGNTAVALAAGYAHTCALLANGGVKCWGYNGEGQLGQGDTVNRGATAQSMGDALPTVDLGSHRALAIAANTGHTCALLDDHSVRCWGNNLYGELGQGDFANRGDRAGTMGANLLPIALGNGRRANAITAGGAFTCAILDNGQVKCWGRNQDGNLGRLWCQDPSGNVADCSTPGFNNPVNGYGVLAGQMGDALPAVDLGTGRTARAISAGTASVCALLDDSSLKCWGSNDYGQLGSGSADPIGVSPSQMGDALMPVAFGNGLSVRGFSSAGLHACALLSNSAVKCWGNNHFGQLGIGNTTNIGAAPGDMGGALQSPAL